MRTALVLPIPDAESLVGEWRARHDPSAREGMPAHVTVLYPFREWEQIDAACAAALEEIADRATAFDLTFSAIGRFPTVRWLKPEPAAPIIALTNTLAAAFPDCKPYGGAHAEPIPHLTFAVGEDAMIDEVARAVEARFTSPIHTRVASCALFAHMPDGWREQRRFRFGKSSRS